MKTRLSPEALLICSTVFTVSVISYVVFWIADALRPGFVARYLSVHAFGALALMSGMALAAFAPPASVRMRSRVILAVLLSLVGALIFWQVSEGSGDTRVFLTLLSLPLFAGLVLILSHD